jgi:hypothetical protein
LAAKSLTPQAKLALIAMKEVGKTGLTQVDDRYPEDPI